MGKPVSALFRREIVVENVASRVGKNGKFVVLLKIVSKGFTVLIRIDCRKEGGVGIIYLTFIVHQGGGACPIASHKLRPIGAMKAHMSEQRIKCQRSQEEGREILGVISLPDKK